EAALLVVCRDRGNAGRQLRVDEQIAGFHAEQRPDFLRAHRAVASEIEIRDVVLTAGGDAKREGELAIGLQTPPGRIGLPVSLLVEVGPDGLRRILEQILVDGSLALDWHQLLEPLRRETIALVGHGYDGSRLGI